VVQAAEHLGVRADVQAGEVEEGEQVAVADVEEEVRGAGVVAVLDQLGQREAEHVLVEAHGPLDVAADQRGVVQAARGRGRALAGGLRWASRMRARSAVAVLVAALQAPGVVLLASAGCPVPALIRWARPGVDDAVVPGGVLVHQRALQHPGDDLHVPVRVGLEAGARRHDVVVVDQQQPVVGVVGS
jgi:hypothetical protein